MKVEFKLFGGLTVFLIIMAVIYGVWTKWTEPVGPVALLLSSLLNGMITFYVWFVGRKIGYRPDDDESGTIDQFEGDYGFFTPYSWSPLWLAGSAAICFAGLAIGWWLFIIGASFGVVALVLWTFENYHGEHAL